MYDFLVYCVYEYILLFVCMNVVTVPVSLFKSLQIALGFKFFLVETSTICKGADSVHLIDVK